MNEKPEAMRLANDLETVIQQEDAEDNVILVPRWTAEESAAELRRLHAEIERLKEVALQAQNAAINLAKQPAMTCAYPHCCAGNRCERMFAGQCSGPRAADLQQ